jgi:hypothetical protein
MITKPSPIARRCRIAGDHRIDPGQRRRVLLQTFDEIPDLRSGAANLDFDAARIVAHPAGKAQFPGQPPDEGTKTDALNDTADADVLTNDGSDMSASRAAASRASSSAIRRRSDAIVARFFSWRARSLPVSQASHCSKPSPVVADKLDHLQGRIDLSGIAIASSLSKERWGSRSTLLSSISEAA